MGARSRSYPDDRYDNNRYGQPRVYDHMSTTYTDSRYTHTHSSDSSNDVSKNQGCAAWLKYGVFTANIVFLVVGGLILTMGTWLRVDSRFRDFLSERYRQVVNDAIWEAPTLYTFSYILIVLGCVMIVVAFLGCCGVTGASRPFLIIYAMAVFLQLVATLSCGIYLFYKQDGLDVELSDTLNYMVQHYYQGAGVVQEALDHLQQTFRCCGNAGCSDFRAFRQDPPRTCDIRCDGCHYRISVALKIGFSITLVVFFFVVLLEILAIIFSLYMVFNQPKKVRIVYVPRNRDQWVAPPSELSLTKETLKMRDLSYDLGRKQRQRM